MEKELDELIAKYEEGNMTLITLKTELLRLFSVMPSLQPFTGEMWQFLLVNALRCLTEEQRAGLCFDLYCRNEHTDSIDKKIKMLKFERKSNEA